VDFSYYLCILRRRWPVGLLVFLLAVGLQLHVELSHLPCYTAEARFSLPSVQPPKDWAGLGLSAVAPFTSETLSALCRSAEFKRKVLAKVRRSAPEFTAELEDSEWTFKAEKDLFTLSVSAPSSEAASCIRSACLSQISAEVAGILRRWASDVLDAIHTAQNRCFQQQAELERKLSTILGCGGFDLPFLVFGDMVSQLERDLEVKRSSIAALRGELWALREKLSRLSGLLPVDRLGEGVGGQVLTEELKTHMKKVIELQIELERDRLTKTEKHPDIQKRLRELQHAKSIIAGLADGSRKLPSYLETLYDRARRALAEEKKRVEARLESLGEELRELEAAYSRRKEILKNLLGNRHRYESVLFRLEALKAKRRNLSEIERACALRFDFTPTTLFRTTLLLEPEARRLNTAKVTGCAMLAFIAALGVCFAVDMASGKVLDAEQLRLLFKAPLLAVLYGEKIEGFSVLYKKLRKTDPGPLSVVVASCGEEVEGAEVSENLARAALSMGERVLVVCCRDGSQRTEAGGFVPFDRRQEIRRRLAGLSTTGRTFPEFLAVDFVEDCSLFPITLRPDGLAQCTLRPETEPGLTASRLKRLLQGASKNYGFIVIECPGRSDPAYAALLAAEASGLVVVVAPGRTRVSRIARLLRTCEGTGVRLFGFVAVVDSAARIGVPLQSGMQVGKETVLESTAV